MDEAVNSFFRSKVKCRCIKSSGNFRRRSVDHTELKIREINCGAIGSFQAI